MKTNWTWWTLGVAFVVLILALFLENGSPSDFSLFLGRFHPLIVHLPIGILLLALVLEGLNRKTATFHTAIPMVLYAGALSAYVAVVAGLFLSEGGGYEEDTLMWHKRLGIFLAVVATIAYWLKGRSHKSDRWQKGYYVSLASVIILVVVGGHLGGVLTRGSDYLTRYMPDPIRMVFGMGSKADLGPRPIENLDEAVVYTDLVQPILESHCTTCHNASKSRGGLALDTPEAILEGGEDGAVIEAGRPSESTIIHRIWLPPTHDDIMPPAGRKPLSASEAELIRWWIDQGASFEQTVAETEIPPAVELIFDGMGIPEQLKGIFALEVPFPDTTAIANVRDLGISVMPLAENLPFLAIHTTNVLDSFGDQELEALLPLAEQIAWLDIGNTQITDAGASVFSSFPNLTRLHLEQTAITDTTLSSLAGLQYLEYLNLYDTGVSDEGLTYLRELPALKNLYLWQSGVTPEGAQQLQQSLPTLEVNLGWTPAVPVADSETP